MNYDIVIIGAGISGATLAERYATQLNKRVLVIEKRDHIGGNCYDFYNDDGLLVSKYGAHIFHTSLPDVWDYVNTFSAFRPYIHKVLSNVEGRLVPVPVTITTINLLFNESLKTEADMKQWLESELVQFTLPQNSEESALSRVGRRLYELMFHNYTKKQWDTEPRDLAASVLDRIPVRYSFDDRYFSDPYQAMPEKGYTELFKKMLDHPNITVQLNTDYFNIKDSLKEYEVLFFTGPIDQFFSFKFGQKLQYRSLKFEFETHDTEFFQSNSVVNYPGTEPYTRIVEYKYLTSQVHPKTTISYEFPTWEGEPYYPVPSKINQQLYEKYKTEAEKEEQKKVYFVGRLANYTYFNMDQAFKNALDLFSRLNPQFRVQ